MADTVLLVYSIADLCLALIISVSNLVVIVVYLRARHIRQTSINVYIFSLAITDFLAGSVGIPLTVFSVLTRWPHTFFPCLAIHLILCVLCTISTFHLLALAVHKCFSICLKKFVQHRSMTVKSIRMRRIHLLIIGCWLFGLLLGGLPLMDGFGFATKTMANFKGECQFTDVVDYRYLVFIIFFGTIVLPSVLIAFCYISIYIYTQHEGQSIHRHLPAAEQKRRISSKRKLTSTLIILVTTFAICWYPLYIINTLDLFFGFNAGRLATLMAVVLSHANCALNPLIYAYGVPGFKQSLRRYFFIFAPVSNISMQGTGGGGACGVPLPGINAHAAWYDHFSAKKQSAAVGTNNGTANKRGNRKTGYGGVLVSTDRRRQSVAQVDINGTTTLVNHDHQAGRRTMSTVNTAFSTEMLRASQRQCDFAQFRRAQNILQSQPPQLEAKQQYQDSTDTDETIADEFLDNVPQQNEQIASEFGTNCSTSNESCQICPPTVEDTDRKRSGQSIASRVSVWSLRIFSGKWRLLRRRTSSAQCLKEIGGGDGGGGDETSGIMLVENRNVPSMSNICSKKVPKNRNTGTRSFLNAVKWRKTKLRPPPAAEEAVDDEAKPMDFEDEEMMEL